MGDHRQYEESSIKEWSTLKESYVLLNGVILTLKNSALTRMPITEKVTHLSCGMSHTLCKTSLKKVYSWGENNMGQLGHGHYHR
jgi:alpha-tubulin suppressor-like RCC1 family protein